MKTLGKCTCQRLVRENERDQGLSAIRLELASDWLNTWLMTGAAHDQVFNELITGRTQHQSDTGLLLNLILKILLYHYLLC